MERTDTGRILQQKRGQGKLICTYTNGLNKQTNRLNKQTRNDDVIKTKKVADLQKIKKENSERMSKQANKQAGKQNRTNKHHSSRQRNIWRFSSLEHIIVYQGRYVCVFFQHNVLAYDRNMRIEGIRPKETS